MALTDAHPLSAARQRLSERLPARVRAWLASEHAPAQRMAGMAFAIRVAGAAVVFLSQILLARWMGPSEFGTYVYAWTWVLLLGDIIHLGLPLTAQRFIPEYTERGQLDRLRGFLFASRLLVFATATGFALLGALAVHAFAQALDSAMVMPLYLACVTLPFFALTYMLDGVARSYNAANTALLPPFVLRPVILIAVMAVAHAAGYRLDAALAMAAFAFATWSMALFQLAILHRLVAAKVPAGPRSYDISRWMATSLPVIAVWAFFTLLTYTDMIVLRYFRPADEVAQYFAAAKTLALVAFIYFSVAAATGHHFTAYHVAGDRQGLMNFVRSTIRWTFWPSLAATALILALGLPILSLFGPAYTAGYPLMFILAVGLVARAGIGPAERVLSMLGEQRLCAAVYACAFGTNLVLAVLLAPRLGGIGAAIATSAGILVESALLFLVAKWRLGLHLFIWRPKAG